MPLCTEPLSCALVLSPDIRPSRPASTGARTRARSSASGPRPRIIRLRPAASSDVPWASRLPGGFPAARKGLSGTSRARPGLDQALAGVRAGDTLVVPKLDRLARSVSDARDIGDALVARGIRLSLGGSIYDPADPMSKMFFNLLAVFAEFEGDLLKMRTREGMAVARSRGRLAGKQPKLSRCQQAELARMHATSDYSIADLTDVFPSGAPPSTAPWPISASAGRAGQGLTAAAGDELTQFNVIMMTCQ